MLGRTGATLFLAGAAEAAAAAQTQTGGAPQGQRVLDVRALGADPSGAQDSAPALQRAIDEIAPTGGIIYIPSGRYRIGRTLLWQNRENARAPGISIQGDGMHSTVLLSAISSGPVLRVRGVRSTGPVNTSFFWGGGIRDLTIQGDNGGAEQHGLEVLGWYYGEIRNCHFVGLGGDGIRAVVDLSVEPNPDFTSSSLFVRGVWLERLGGWGFRDSSEVQAAPVWSWDHCVFVFCRRGGALVRSGSLSFTKCGFAGCGWQSEQGPTAQAAYALYFDGAATTCSQQWVEGCEFDTNLTAHIGARFLAASSFFNNRFIFSDRHAPGRLRPAVGVEIGSGDASATILGVEFRQSFFRFDVPGEAVAFDFVNNANVRDVEIGGSVFTEPRGVAVTRYRGHDPNGRGAAYGYVIRDRPRAE
jgi:Pectate lyase superfamily protein